MRLKAISGADGVVFDGRLPAGTVAYVDGAAAAAGGDVEALVVGRADDVDDAGPRALGALGSPLSVALEETDEPIVVVGEGAVAAAIRAGRRAPVGDERPAVVVELTGSPVSIRAAAARLRDLGSLLLARDPSEAVDLDLYADVHVRGLRLVGVPAPDSSDVAGELAPSEPPASAVLGRPAPAGAAWYRVEGPEAAA